MRHADIVTVQGEPPGASPDHVSYLLTTLRTGGAGSFASARTHENHQGDPPERFPDIFAAILVGGRARRMGGVDKALLRVGGTTFLERLVALLRPFVAEVVLSGRAGQAYPETGCRLVADRRDNAGPLAGLEAVLASAPVAWCFLVACDMPAIDAQVLDRLAAARRTDLHAVVPRTRALEPTCALYHVDVLTAASAALDRGERALHRLVAELSHVEIVFEAALADKLRNVNQLPPTI